MLKREINRQFHELKIWMSRQPLPGGFRLWITVISLAFVSSTIYNNSAQLSSLSLNGNAFAWLGLGTLISLLSLLVNAFAWSTLVGWLDLRPKKLNLISLFLSSNLLKYLPGGIWHFLERLRILRLHMDYEKALTSVLLEPILMVAAALLWVPFGGWQSGLALCCCLPLFALNSRWRDHLLNRIRSNKAKQFQRVQEGAPVPLQNQYLKVDRDGYPWSALFIEMGFVACRFGGFLCCLIGFSVDGTFSLFEWLAAFAFAWTVGLIVPAAPGGVGVFEATILLRLGSSASSAPFLGAILCYRLVVTIADGLAVLCVFAAPRFLGTLKKDW